ncbi:MAG TPA: hypothetical protein VHY76_12520 [Acetobacteraceae bacterium]|nr:hypothetical protein [Acetobacteraceae bacterium]
MFALLCGSAGFGMFAAAHMRATYRGRETFDMMALVIGMLVTFAGLVLGLLTATVKAAYHGADHDIQEYALQLTQFDQSLRDLGRASDPARSDMKTYTAALIASIWPDERPPVGVSYPNTSGMPRVGSSPVVAELTNRVGLEIDIVNPADPLDAHVVEACRQDYREVLRARQGVIEDAREGLSTPFSRVLVF